MAVLVKDELDFTALNVHASALLAQAGTVAVQLFHGRQLAQHLGILGLDLSIRGPGQQGIDLRVHALDPAADDGLDKTVIGQVSVLIQPHEAGERQTQLFLIQRADAIGELLRQHGDDLVGIVNTGSTAECFIVQLTARLDIIGNIRNVDAQLKAAVRSLGQADGIVDVLGLGAVDGEDGQGTQVHAALTVGLGNRHVLKLFGFFPHLIRETAADVLGVEQSLGAALGLVRAAKPHGNTHAVVFLTVAAHEDLHSDLVAVLGTALAIPHELHGNGRAVVRDEFQTAIHPAGRAHQVIFLGEDGKDLALITALHTGVGKLLHQHFIARHGTAGKAARNKDITGAIVQHNKGKVLPQLDHLAQQGFLRAARADGEEHALLLADDRLMHQLVQCFHHLAVRTAVSAKLRFQILDGAGLVLDRMFNFIA